MVKHARMTLPQVIGGMLKEANKMPRPYVLVRVNQMTISAWTLNVDKSHNVEQKIGVLDPRFVSISALLATMEPAAENKARDKQGHLYVTKTYRIKVEEWQALSQDVTQVVSTDQWRMLSGGTGSEET